MRAMELVTIICAVLAALVCVVGALGANGAPQEAAAPAMAIALVAIPYTITATLQRRELLNRSAPPVV